MTDHRFGVDCPDEPHLHDTTQALVHVLGGRVLVAEHVIVGVFNWDATPIAERCCELLARYGLADIPDTPEALAE